jgi:hypothetical protein
VQQNTHNKKTWQSEEGKNRRDDTKGDAGGLSWVGHYFGHCNLRSSLLLSCMQLSFFSAFLFEKGTRERTSNKNKKEIKHTSHHFGCGLCVASYFNTASPVYLSLSLTLYSASLTVGYAVMDPSVVYVLRHSSAHPPPLSPSFLV